ncbi:hypothetical protein EV359DRAFT_69257, partial [Lentinula novae-zelandiae]
MRIGQAEDEVMEVDNRSSTGGRNGVQEGKNIQNAAILGLRTLIRVCVGRTSVRIASLVGFLSPREIEEKDQKAVHPEAFEKVQQIQFDEEKSHETDLAALRSTFEASLEQKDQAYADVKQQCLLLIEETQKKDDRIKAACQDFERLVTEKNMLQSIFEATETALQNHINEAKTYGANLQTLRSDFEAVLEQRDQAYAVLRQQCLLLTEEVQKKDSVLEAACAKLRVEKITLQIEVAEQAAQ